MYYKWEHHVHSSVHLFRVLHQPLLSFHIQSVEFEDITGDIELLSQAGIPIFKLQEAAALRVDNVTPEIVEELKKYTGTIYLSQTTELRNGVITRFLNLEDAIAAWEKDPGPREWRTHFHVPVFIDSLGPFKTTRSGLS